MMAFHSTEQLLPRLVPHLDGSLTNGAGVRVGRMVRSGRMVPQFTAEGRPLGPCVVHGWSVVDLHGVECVWTGHYGDTLALAPGALDRAARNLTTGAAA